MSRTAGFAAVLVVVCLLPAGCSRPASTAPASTASIAKPVPVASTPLPDATYWMQPGLPKWVDAGSGYDTTRAWKLDGTEWPVMLVLSPSQSPQALFGFEAGIFGKKLGEVGVTPKLEKLDGPPRVFHALERSKWPFVYMPLAVFMDYVRSPKNQGDAGGLQYVALAGSTAGGGYTLLAKDPAIKTVADLKGKRVAFQNTNPVPGTLLTQAAKNAGLGIGVGPGDIHVGFGEAGAQMNAYEAGEYDALVTMNIYKAALLKAGSHAVTDLSNVGYRPNYTILVVERSVLEKRPEVVKAFLEAHYESEKLAQAAWKDGTAVDALFKSWNGFFAGQDTKWSSQRPVADSAAYKAMLGDMYPEMRLDRTLIDGCFRFNTVHGTWGWPGTVDVSKIVDYDVFNTVLKAHGEALQ